MGDGGGPDVDYVAGEGHDNCSMADLGDDFRRVSELGSCARISPVEF